MEAIELFLYSASLIAVSLYFFLSLRRSEFGVILVGYDFFFFLGCCVYPIVFEAGWVTPGIEGQASLASIGKPGLLTAIHVFAVASGMLLGYLFGSESGRTLSKTALSRSQDTADFLFPHPSGAWRAAVLLGISVMLTYMWIVGFDVALINAALARGGEFEGFGDDTRWLFLKTVAIVLGYCFVFLPAVILSKTNRPFLILYVALAALIYLNTPSRGLILWLVVVPVTVWLYASRLLLKPYALVVLPLGIFAAAAILLYGKPLGNVSGILLAGDSVDQLDAFQSDSGFWGVGGALLRNMEFQWFSISAGIKYFFDSGPLIPTDVLVAPLGVVPVRVMEWLGFGYLNYGMVDVKLACTNTAMFRATFLDGCTIPPLYSGYSAYLAPVAGGLVLSFWRNWYFGRFESIWMAFRKRGFERLWFPYLGVHLVALFFSFIAPNIAMASFVLALLIAYGIAKSVKAAFFRRLSEPTAA